MCNGEVWSFVMVKKQQRTEPLKQDYKYSRYQQIWSVKVMYTYVYIATATMSVCLSVCLSVTLHLPLVTSVSCASQQTDLANEHSLWPALGFGTSCWLLHEPPAPTHQTVSNEHWRRSCFSEWLSCCRWQHPRGTALVGCCKTIASTLTLCLNDASGCVSKWDIKPCSLAVHGAESDYMDIWVCFTRDCRMFHKDCLCRLHFNLLFTWYQLLGLQNCA